MCQVASECHLEVEDSGVFVVEALTVRNHAAQQALIERERADGGEQPAVSWEDKSSVSRNSAGFNG